MFSEENYVPQPTNWFRRQSADNAHFYSLYNVVSLKIRSRSPKSNQFLNYPMARIHHLVQEIVCKKAFFGQI